MSKTEMPAAEAHSYELAFHVLPTVAEGEVTTVFQQLKDLIIKHGGTITAEEVPARFELAYEVVKHLEGRNRKFTSAYFGWIRFEVAPAEISEITEVVEHTKELLRHLLIKLTKVEEGNPFFFHEALASDKQVETIDLDEATVVEAESTETQSDDSEKVAVEAEEKAESEESGAESK